MGTNTYKYYLIYLIYDKATDMVYIGSHKTNNLNDYYMGSGKALKFAQRSFLRNNPGKPLSERFYKKIIHECDNAEDMYYIEKEIVSEEYVKRKDTYNLVVGGRGNAKDIRQAELSRKKISDSMKKRYQALSEDEKLELVNRLKGAVVSPEARKAAGQKRRGQKHTVETKKKMSEKLKGRKSWNMGIKIWSKEDGDKSYTNKAHPNLGKPSKTKGKKGHACKWKGRPGHKHNEETKKKLSIVGKGRIRTEEQKRSAADKNRGQKRTEEQKARIKAAASMRPQISKETRARMIEAQRKRFAKGKEERERKTMENQKMRKAERKLKRKLTEETK